MDVYNGCTSWIEDDCPDPFFWIYFSISCCSCSVSLFLIGWQCWNIKCNIKFWFKQLDWFGKCCALVNTWVWTMDVASSLSSTYRKFPQSYTTHSTKERQSFTFYKGMFEQCGSLHWPNLASALSLLRETVKTAKEGTSGSHRKCFIFYKNFKLRKRLFIER